MDATEKAFHRIDSFNRFIYKLQQLMLCIGACLGIATCVFFYISNHPHYLYISSGLATVSLIWTLRFGGSLLIKKGQLPRHKGRAYLEIGSTTRTLVQGKFFFGIMLIVLVLSSAIILLSNINRGVLACLIPWILLVAIEYTVLVVHEFRLGLLSQEVYPDMIEP